MNKFVDGWIMVDKSMVDKNMLDKSMVDKSMVDKSMVDNSMVDKRGVNNVFRSQNNKQCKDVKSEVPDWTIINYPDLNENESKVQNNLGSSWNKENKENQYTKDSGGGWWEISLKD